MITLKVGHFLIGVPFEKIENTLGAVKLNAKVMSHKAHVAIFQPYPHTRLYKIRRENGFLDNSIKGVSTFLGDSILKLPTISKEQIQFAYKYFPIFVKFIHDCLLCTTLYDALMIG
jgi:hypothetical protein